MEKKEAKKIVKEMSPKMFLSGLEGVLRSGNYKTIEFRVTCDNGDAQKDSKGNMTNNQYNKLLHRLVSAKLKYKQLLKEAENEFEKRFGSHPSDIDYDPWIDTYHISGGFLSIETMEGDSIGGVKRYSNHSPKE